MPPLMQEAFASILRHFLTIAAGVLVTQGIWTESQATTYVAAAALAVVGIGWSLYQKYGSRLKLVTALATPSVTSENAIEARVASGDTPPVNTPKTVVPR